MYVKKINATSVRFEPALKNKQNCLKSLLSLCKKHFYLFIILLFRLINSLKNCETHFLLYFYFIFRMKKI